MGLDILTMIALLGYIYVMVFVLKLNDHLEMGLLTLVFLLYLYVKNRNMKIEGYKSNNIVSSAESFAPAGGCSSGKCTKQEVKDVPEIIMKDNKPPKSGTPQKIKMGVSDTQGLMSNYDGLCLQTGNKDQWRLSPSDLPLSSDNGLYTIFGSTAPVNPVFSDNSGKTGPPIDGMIGSPQSLFMLGNNKVSPDCCPSTFSTSTGCVCSTHNQREFVKNRGNNVSGNPPII